MEKSYMKKLYVMQAAMSFRMLAKLAGRRRLKVDSNIGRQTLFEKAKKKRHPNPDAF